MKFSKVLKNIKSLLGRQDVARVCFLLFCGIFVCTDIFAQSAVGGAGFSGAADTLKHYKGEVSTLLKAIGAIIALVGAFTVYFKMQNGDQDIKKSIMMTIGGCIAFVALSEMLPLFFD